MAEGRGSRVNFDEDKQLVFETSANVKVVNSFQDMGLKEELIRGIFAYGAWNENARSARARWKNARERKKKRNAFARAFPALESSG